ncbi:glutamine amidotransferase [Ancylobacter sp. Lp-2]|uniref:glutamine amidotransferase-related protein n=1 Tax=Ancylobacter sp. Lp-2 TaxID=2881339 RepID=UPI001E52173D|nr:glutamine amidotransferase [Ancylobacter sp. Lp-2]MCB4770429.1 glutamine amidotransferase [Ancylobacter sp. Lp-2]
MASKVWSSKTRSAVALRHVAFEDLGRLAGLLDARGWQVSYSEATTEHLAHYSVREADLVVVLGGPIHLCDAHAYPFLAREMRLIERRLELGLPTLGIGLGARLMARVLGAAVHRADGIGIGWGDISLTAEGLRSPLAALSQPGETVLHWRRERFDLPSGARRLAFSGRDDNEAFSYGPAALALQFHIEADGRALEEWYVGHAAELRGQGIDVARLRRQGRLHTSRQRQTAAAVFDGWLDTQFPDDVPATMPAA